MPAVRRAAAEVVRLGGRGVQGQRLLPDRQPSGIKWFAEQRRQKEVRRRFRDCGQVQWRRQVNQRHQVGPREQASSGRRGELTGYPQGRIQPALDAASPLSVTAQRNRSTRRRALSRLSQALRPDWSRTLAARRALPRGWSRLPGWPRSDPIPTATASAPWWQPAI